MRPGFRTEKKVKRATPIKSLTFKVFTPDCNSYQVFRVPGSFNSKESIEMAKQGMTELLDSLFPNETFHFVPLGRNHFNVLHRVGNA